MLILVELITHIIFWDTKIVEIYNLTRVLYILMLSLRIDKKSSFAKMKIHCFWNNLDFKS